MFSKIAPKESIIDDVSFYRFFYDEDNPYAAYVEQDENDFDKWILGVNLVYANNVTAQNEQQLIETLIHEYAHIVTLDEDQRDASISERNCKGIYLDEGCMNESSYVTGFVESFWDDEDFDHVDEIEDADEDEQDEIAQDYFGGNEDRFVTAYATTHPAEDIAESFALFVTEEKPTSRSKLSDRKIDYFYGFDYLVSLRDNVRNQFNNFLNF